MEKADVIDKLIHFNLSRQEAIVYICLWENDNISGYEVSKLTGISRSNVYGALNTLAEKGAARITETNTTLYSAVDPEEFLNNKLRQLKEDKKYIVENLPQIQRQPEGYITIQGNRNIKDKIHNMIQTCRMRLYMSADKEVMEEFSTVLKAAKERGLKVVLMSDTDCSHLATDYYCCMPEKGQVRLITDSAYVLTGELMGRSSDTCLYSGQNHLVTIMKEALRDKIHLLRLEENEQNK